MLKIFAWCDGTWCYEEELEDYSWMSDDFTPLWITADAGYDDIELAVDKWLRGL